MLDETFFRWLCILHLLASLESSYLILEQLLVGEPISDYNITRFPSKAYNVCTPKASDIALSYQKVTIRVFLNITCLSCNVLLGETRGKGMVEEKLEVSIVHGISYILHKSLQWPQSNEEDQEIPIISSPIRCLHGWLKNYVIVQ